MLAIFVLSPVFFSETRRQALRIKRSISAKAVWRVEEWRVLHALHRLQRLAHCDGGFLRNRMPMRLSLLRNTLASVVIRSGLPRRHRLRCEFFPV